MNKPQRQHRISQLLEGEVVASQGELVALLAAEGIAATQATVSRDLLELGAVKIRDDAGRRRLAIGAGAPTAASTEQLRRVLAEWVVEVHASGALVVVKTPPGCAHVVASALDRGSLAAAIGTVAGDDTIFVAVDERVGGAALAAELRQLAGLPAARATPRRRARATQKGR